MRWEREREKEKNQNRSVVSKRGEFGPVRSEPGETTRRFRDARSRLERVRDAKITTRRVRRDPSWIRLAPRDRSRRVIADPPVA